MHQTTTLERRKETDARAERILAGALKGRGGALTRADAVALSGLSVDETDAALKTLLHRYRSHLEVTDKGELIYQFDPAMVRRDAHSLGDRLRELGAWLWKGFTFLFKIWIAFTLIFYVILFLAMTIALVFARSGDDRDDRREGGGFGMPWIIWWMMPDWAPPEARRRRLPRRPQKRFYRSVFDFVFGPPGAPQDALESEKEVVAYLRSRQGRITSTDLVALTGWSYQRAEEEATRLLVAYDGEPEIAEDGTLVYAFPALRTTAGGEQLADPGQPWRYTWNQARSVAPLTGNSGGTDAVIGALNGFNLFAALTIAPTFLARYGLALPGADVAVTWFPVAFSSLFYGIPAVRALKRSRQQRRQVRETVRARLIGQVIAREGAPTAPEVLVAEAAKGMPGAEDLARPALERLLVDLDGDVTTDEQGRTLYAFPRVREELVAASAARRLAPAAERHAGQVVFSSRDEQDQLPEAESSPALPPPGSVPRLLK